jgi:ribosomal protein S18 acetylase RimI-like enzyme
MSLDERRARRREMWPAILADPRARVYAAGRGETILGFAHVGPSRGAAPQVGELYAIYVHPTAWDQGIGRLLITTGEGALRELGYGAAILWVLGTNQRARDFYEAAGWRADGATKIEDAGAGVKLHEVRYTRELRD